MLWGARLGVVVEVREERSVSGRPGAEGAVGTVFD